MSVVESAANARAQSSQSPSVCMHVLTTARTDQRVMREATALVQAGYAVTIVDMERETSRPAEEVIEGVRIKHIMMPGRYKRTRFKPWFLVKLAGMMARGSWVVARTPADVYHAHDDNALLPCYVASRLRRAKLVFDAHELPLAQPTVTRWKRLTAIARAALRRMAPRCDGVITVSAPIAEEMRRQFGVRPATLVRNIPPYRPPDETSGIISRKLGLPADTHVALYQGIFQENRSLDVLVRAARYLDDGHVIVLMGSGPALPSIESLARAEGVTDRVRFLPPAPYEELLQWTASVDLGLIMYRGDYSLNVRYCLPNKLFEYLMSGVPVASTQLDAVVDILRRYDVGVVAPSIEPEVVGGTISAALRDVAGRARMRGNALAASAGELRWEVEQASLVALYDTVTGAIPAPAHALAQPARGAR